MLKSKSLIIALSAFLFTFYTSSIYGATKEVSYKTNPLKLYSEVTSLTMAFNEKYGKKADLPYNEKQAISLILKNSSTKKYMLSDDYNSFKKNSEFSKQTSDMMKALATLINKFKKIGFIDEIKSQGKTPALMFDIDNTVELTSFDDDYWTKSGINDPATAKFIKQICFKDGISCYFITARACNAATSKATKEWLKKHIGLTDDQLKNNVFLSGSVPHYACTNKANTSVAYKDMLREALSDSRNVYWLMSIGDQMTDWFGEHSGLKVWYPNQMFDNSIVANDYNHPNKKPHLRQVIAPTKECYAKFKDNVLKQSTLSYCSEFSSNKYINA
ncbi:hypothetical protein [Francisella sp. 19X1-34]|uniref:hypothetical protein n=1 Tax=Francisella sp. 19X1-34 TaxID=3087177 RepID=UPI002E37865B|nr:hypothetical protein [Francisella sp. 19X1-34]MED7788839.1 hypothetical protein [Francisella sp. 19X1-34]